LPGSSISYKKYYEKKKSIPWRRGLPEELETPGGIGKGEMGVSGKKPRPRAEV